jgi:ribosomal protein S18 acetylase RimI-like enzyme
MSRVLFADVALVRRIEGAEVRFVMAGGYAAQRRRPDAIVTPLSGGAGVCSGEASPFDKVVGLGFEALDENALGQFERAVLERGGAVQVELATRADPKVAQALSQRGYALIGFEDVLGLPPEPGAAEGGELEVRAAGPGELDTWIDTVVTGFAHPDAGDGVPSHESFSRDALVRTFRDLLSLPEVKPYLAWRNGAIAGGALLRLDSGIAQLSGAATLPAHRRRGVQTALTRARISDAARAGAQVATVTTLPGSKSQENVTRQGFCILYTRAVLIKRSALPGMGSAVGRSA